jgi:hypothetical protein
VEVLMPSLSPVARDRSSWLNSSGLDSDQNLPHHPRVLDAGEAHVDALVLDAEPLVLDAGQERARPQASQCAAAARGWLRSSGGTGSAPVSSRNAANHGSGATARSARMSGTTAGPRATMAR